VKLSIKTTPSTGIDDVEFQMAPSGNEARELDLASSAEWTVIQSDILHIVAKLSKQSPNQIDQQTSFFRLGLDSINAAQIAAYLRRKGWDISPVEVIEVSPFNRSLMKFNKVTHASINSIRRFFSYLLTFKLKNRSQIKTKFYLSFRPTIENSGVNYVSALVLRVMT
jgi:aryl carrier-like protein